MMSSYLNIVTSVYIYIYIAQIRLSIYIIFFLNYSIYKYVHNDISHYYNCDMLKDCYSSELACYR